LIDDLIERQPQRRRLAARVPQAAAVLSVDETKQALAYLAYHAQVRIGSRSIDRRDAQAIVEEFLTDERDGLGLKPRSARQVSEALLDLGGHVLGLLVEPADRQVRFLHRTFQEALAANHIATFALAEQVEAVEQYGSDPAWREILLCLLAYTRSRSQVGDLVRRLRAVPFQPMTATAHEELLCEIACGDFALPADLARELADQSIA
jgi:predicted NACHT family NTPase